MAAAVLQSSEAAPNQHSVESILQSLSLRETLVPLTPPPNSHSFPHRLSLRHGATAAHVLSYVEAMCRNLQKSMLHPGTGELVCIPTSATPSFHSLYRTVGDLGRGHLGVVTLCEEVETGQHFACKTVERASLKRREDIQELWSEVSAPLRIQRARSPKQQTVHLHEVVEDEAGVHLIMDRCAGGDLFEHIAMKGKLSEAETAAILCQLVDAVSHVHACGLVHRDIKPENVLLTGERCQGGCGATEPLELPRVLLADFGLCVPLRKGQVALGRAGSPFYIAPEVLSRNEYSHAVDVWSLGVIVYTCLSGCLPFWGRSTGEVFASVVRAKPDFQRKSLARVTLEAKDLISCMLRSDPTQRITLDGIKVHPWMRQRCGEGQHFVDSAETLSQSLKEARKLPVFASIKSPDAVVPISASCTHLEYSSLM